MGATRSALTLALLASMVTGAASAASEIESVCPLPKKGLQRNAPNVDTETIPFSDEGLTYQLDIYSGFAPQQQAAGANFCVRYEVENASAADILVLHWPLAGVTIEKLEHGLSKRRSFIATAGARQPILADTRLYAFKSESLSSKAYQSTAKWSMTSPLLQFVADTNEATQAVKPLPGEPVPVPLAGAFPIVGGEFSSSDGAVGSLSALRQEGNEVLFNVNIYHSGSDAASPMIAPFTAALMEAESPSQIVYLMEKFGSFVLTFDDLELKKTKSFPASKLPGPFYLIRQPITFEDDNGGRVCFLSPTYSPVDVPPDLLACK